MKKILIMLLLVMLVVPLAHADITSGLQGYWKFDNNLRDETSNYNDGIAVNSLSYMDGYIGKGIHTDTAWSAVNVGNSTTLQINDSITIAMWFRILDEYSGGGWLVSKSTWYGVYDEMSMWFSTAPYDNAFYFARDNDHFIASGDQPEYGGWYHIALTVDENQTRLYINGSLVETGASVFTATKSANAMWIGNLVCEGAYGMDAIFDEVRIYNRTLSYDDVEELFAYNGSTPTTTTTVPSSTTTTIISVTGDILANQKISYATCLDNQTLKNAYVFYAGNATQEKNQIIYCDYGCVTTGNTTAECTPSPLNKNLILVGIFVVIIILILVIFKLGNFR